MIRLSGEYGGARKRVLEGQLAEVYDADIALLDMRDVTGIDRSCALLLLAIAAGSRSKSSPRMVGTRSTLRATLEAHSIPGTFEYFGTLREALEAI